MARLEAGIDLESGLSPAPRSTAVSAIEPSLRNNQKRGGCCCSGLVYFVLLATLLLGALYLALDPKLPRYTMDALTVTAFDMDDDLTARAQFNASVRFENPNRAIGIRYEEGSSLSVWFGGYRLSEGALPAFYQGHRDAALVHVAMSEARLRGTGVVEAMRHVNGDGGGELPLVFRGEVPVRVKVGPFTMPRVTPSVKCDLVLDRLATEGNVRVKSLDCKFSMKLRRSGQVAIWVCRWNIYS